MQIDLRTLVEHLGPLAVGTAVLAVTALLAVGVRWWWRHQQSRH
jgi:hypothetical protein